MTTRVGQVVRRLDESHWLVDFPGNVHGPLPARSLASAADEVAAACQRQREVLLVFDGGDPLAPLIVGSLAKSQPAALHVTHVAGRTAQVNLDGEALVLRAGRSVRLECGESSISMHADGTVIIKGRKILTQATESNRVRGGTVCIN